MKRTILFLAANPRGTDKLALDEECAAIEQELRLAAGRDDFEFRSRWAVGVDDLMRCLNELSPTVLHFSGHGSRGPARTTDALASPQRHFAASPGAGIMLQDRDCAHHVDPHALAKMIASVPPVPRLVVLNACHSSSVAESLRQVVDCVVGVDGAIEDATARSFAVGFYRALGYRRPVGIAAQQAAATLYGKHLPGEIVTCHPRDGVDANQLYLTVPSAAPDPCEPSVCVPPVPPAAVREPPPNEPPAREVSATTARARSQPTSSETWPMVAAPYDLFVTHPPANKASARALYDLLQFDLRVFLASRSLSPGDRLEEAVTTAQRSSRATVLLISPHADAAWYLGDEIVTAIALHHAAPKAHRLVPVLLEAGLALPSSLSHVEPIVAPAVGDLRGVAARLRDLVAALPRDTAPWTAEPSGRRSDRRGCCDHVWLYDRLGQLGDAALEQIVALAGIERASLAPRTAAVAERALDIAQLAAIDPTLCRRISAELDRRAPWTRR
jgi:hypothetical protein